MKKYWLLALMVMHGAPRSQAGHEAATLGAGAMRSASAMEGSSDTSDEWLTTARQPASASWNATRSAGVDESIGT